MNYYELKMVLLALRKEYLKIQEKLEEAKKCIEIKDPNEKVYICLSRIHENNPLDLQYVIDNGEKVKKSDRTNSSVGTLYDSRYDRFYNQKNLNISQEGKDKIVSILNDLNNSEFAKNMSMYDGAHFYERDKEGKSKSLIIWDDIIDYSERNKDWNTLIGSVLYRAYEDKLYFEKEPIFKRVNDDLVQELLERKLPEYLFREYHKELIESYPSKEVEIINNKRNTFCNRYDIEETEKKLILKR